MVECYLFYQPYPKLVQKIRSHYVSEFRTWDEKQVEGKQGTAYKGIGD